MNVEGESLYLEISWRNVKGVLTDPTGGSKVYLYDENGVVKIDGGVMSKEGGTTSTYYYDSYDLPGDAIPSGAQTIEWRGYFESIVDTHKGFVPFKITIHKKY